MPHTLPAFARRCGAGRSHHCPVLPEVLFRVVACHAGAAVEPYRKLTAAVCMDVLCVPALAQLRPSGQRYCPGNDFAVYWSLLRRGASTAQQAGAHRCMGPARWQPPPNPKAGTDRPHRGFCADAGQAGQMLPPMAAGSKKVCNSKYMANFCYSTKVPAPYPALIRRRL